MSVYKRARYRYAPAASGASVTSGYTRSGITVRGRDLFGTLKASGQNGANEVVANNTIDINNTEKFPWVGKFASLFDSFKFLDLKFHYEPECPSSTIGGIIMGYNGDPTAPDKGSFDEIVKEAVHVHGNLWSRHTMNVPQSLCASRKDYYTREKFDTVGPVVSATTPFRFDPLEYYPGRFNAFWNYSQGPNVGQVPPGSIIGRIFVEYIVTFGRPEQLNGAITNVNNLQIAPTMSENVSTVSMFLQAPNPAPSYPGSAIQVLFGKNQPNNVRGGGHKYFGVNDLGETFALESMHLTLVITAAGTSGTNFSAGAGYPIVNSTSPTGSSTTIDGVEKAFNRWETINTHSSYTVIWQLNLQARDTISVVLNYAAKLTQWHIRFFAAAYNVDVAGTQT